MLQNDTENLHKFPCASSIDYSICVLLLYKQLCCVLQRLPRAVLSEQRHQFRGGLCDLLHPGFHVLWTERPDLRSSRIWWDFCKQRNSINNPYVIFRVIIYFVSALVFSQLSCLCRSWPCLHSLPPCCEHDALLSCVGRPLLHHDCVSGAWQPGRQLCAHSCSQICFCNIKDYWSNNCVNLSSVCVCGEPCDGDRGHVPPCVPPQEPQGALPLGCSFHLLPRGPHHADGGRWGCHTLGPHTYLHTHTHTHSQMHFLSQTYTVMWHSSQSTYTHHIFIYIHGFQVIFSIYIIAHSLHSLWFFVLLETRFVAPSINPRFPFDYLIKYFILI